MYTSGASQPSIQFHTFYHWLDERTNIEITGKKHPIENEAKFKLNILKMMEFQMTSIILMDSHDIGLGFSSHGLNDG